MLLCLVWVEDVTSDIAIHFLAFVSLGHKPHLCAAFVCKQQNFLKWPFVARELEVCSNILQLWYPQIKLDDLYIKLGSSVQVFVKATSFLNFAFVFVKVYGKGEGRNSWRLTAGTAQPYLQCVQLLGHAGKWLAFSNHLAGYLARFLSVLRGRRRDSSALREWRQRDRPSFQER